MRKSEMDWFSMITLHVTTDSEKEGEYVCQEQRQCSIFSKSWSSVEWTHFKKINKLLSDIIITLH